MRRRRFYKLTEIALMRHLAAENKSQVYAARVLDRDPGSVAKAALRYGIAFNAGPGRPLGDPEGRRRRRAENCRRYRQRHGAVPKMPKIARFDDPRLMVS